jgi:hypothetical protein|tara:strand:- start:6 stop:506 length:501 start_codon:yes stop_codon:yes gene_type:complete
MKNYKTALKGIIGENLVTAELARRDIVATTFTGNIPDIDILAFKDYKTIPLQVKTLTKGSLHIADVTKYLKIEREGKKQIIKGLNKINENLIFVIVKIGGKYSEDEFYIVRQKIIQNIVLKNHSNALKKWKGIRPRNPDSLHSAYDLSDIDEYRDNWKLIVEELQK